MKTFSSNGGFKRIFTGRRQKVVVGGCVTNHIMGKFDISTGAAGAGGLILPKVLEEILEEGLPGGLEPRPNVPKTRDSREFRSSVELLDALCTRLNYYMSELKISWTSANRF